MAINTTPQAILLGNANYYQVTRIIINTPVGGDKQIVVNYCAYERTLGDPNAEPPVADSYELLKEFQAEVAGADLLALASSAPVGSNLSDVIKHGVYAYLQSKGLIPEGEAV